MVSLEFFMDINFPIALWHWGRVSLWQKWVPGAFTGGKSGRCVRLTTLPPYCAVVMKSGNIKFLEPSGPRQACNGRALLLPSLPIIIPTVMPAASFESAHVDVYNKDRPCNFVFKTSYRIFYVFVTPLLIILTWKLNIYVAFHPSKDSWQCSKHILFDLSRRLASNDTVDSFLRHREVGRAKDLSAPRYIIAVN